MLDGVPDKAMKQSSPPRQSAGSAIPEIASALYLASPVAGL
jgi:hypothetical protein